jgi:pilus assembly protein Flp/PilA
LSRVIQTIRRLIRGQEAATAVEYAVMLALILTVIIAAISSFGTKNGGMWAGIVATLRAAGVIS